jgi:hypothetical protein
MNIQRDNVDERRQRVDAILAQVRSSTCLRPARIRRVTRSLGRLADQVRPDHRPPVVAEPVGRARTMKRSGTEPSSENGKLPITVLVRWLDTT